MGFLQAYRPDLTSWKKSYMAALFEIDKSKLLQRIDDAETAVVLRTRELFQSPGENLQERRALEAALCALRALRSIAQNQSLLARDRNGLAA
jgi:hypothetical protein